MPYFKYHQHRIFYRSQGDGPLLLILPGNTASSRCYQGELAYFGKNYRAVSLDFLGTGSSDRILDWPADWWSRGAEQVRDLILHLGCQEAVVMGSSGGAVIALLLAIRFPETVRGVIADSVVEKFSPEMLEQNVIKGRAQMTEDQVQFWSFAHGEDWQQVVDADTAVLKKLAGRGGDWFGGRLKEIQCPVLLTASLQDEFFPDVVSQVSSMALQIPDCNIFLANHGGHPMMWTQAQAFRQTAKHFLEQFM